MRFETKNNLRYFIFEEVTIMDIEVSASSVTLVMKGLIVKGNNPNNEECVDRFVDTANLRFVGGRISNVVKEGYKYYDANGNLKPDESVLLTDIDVLLKNCKEVALYDVVALSESDSGYVYQVGIDLNENDTYWIDISCEQTIVEWERFMNKVM